MVKENSVKQLNGLLYYVSIAHGCRQRRAAWPAHCTPEDLEAVVSDSVGKETDRRANTYQIDFLEDVNRSQPPSRCRSHAWSLEGALEEGHHTHPTIIIIIFIALGTRLFIDLDDNGR